jgi:hypothetical protein
MGGDEGSVFPACYLQGTVQPQLVARLRDSNLTDDALSADSPFAPHRAAPAVIGKRDSNLRVQKIAGVANPLFPIVFNNGKNNSSV